MNWRMVGALGRDGLAPLESDGGARLAAEVRGGIAWPWPVAVGARLVAAGAVAVVAWAPADRCARLVWWRLTGSVGAVFGPDGWPLDGGVAGALRDCALMLGCLRWYALCPAADQVESLRVVRRVLPELPTLRVTAVDDQMSPDDVRAVLFRWASERRLVDIPAEALAEIEREEGDLAGPRPLTAAVAAALESLERRPWRPGRREEWEPLPREVLASP
jgi:hypothetical protein